MLYELSQYAKKNNLLSKPGYKSKSAKWVVVLDKNGTFIGIIAGREFSLCPNLEPRELISGGKTRSHFLLDSASVLLGESDDPKVLLKHQCFLELLYSASPFELLLKLCADALDNDAIKAAIKEGLAAHKSKPTDSITFKVSDVYPIELDTWSQWWDTYRDALNTKAEEKGASTNKMLCLLSGNLITPVLSHSKVGGLSRVGGQPFGTMLISFDKEAFQSYGLEQSQNAACGEDEVSLYRTALDDLIAKAPPPLGGTFYLHWYQEPIPEDDDPFGLSMLGGSNAENDARTMADRLINSIQEGTRPELLNNRYYLLAVSGSGGRVMVRSWQQGDYSDLVSKIQLWFDDLDIVSPDGKSLQKSFKLAAAQIRLVSFRANEQVSKTFDRINEELTAIMPALFSAIITGGQLCDTIAARALLYLRSNLLQGEGDNLDPIACALLKAWVIRKKGGNIMSERLNLDNPSPVYHAGRLLAVLAHLQNAALGDVGAGVVQRYYTAASTTPALILGRLVSAAQYHLSKIDNKGLVVWYEKLISEISLKIGDQLPKTVDLEGQTLFALGYYQQKAVIFGTKAENKENENGDDQQ